jgi:spermidine synthase
MPTDGSRSRLLYALFLLSGAAGLIYQVVWSRLFHELFGITVYAVTTVLATFLGGLALGGWWLGRAVDRRSDPLRFYGLLELGIAVSAVVGTLVLRALDPLHVAAANRLAPDSPALVLVRLLLASIVVLPCTILMGGTLPAMTRVFVGRIREIGRELSALYALNTLGAVAGTLAAGFVLIRWLGLHGTLLVGVVTNLVVGVLALALAKRKPARRADVLPGEAEVRPPPESRDRGRGLLIVAALSGFVSLGLEVLWTRMLILRIGTTTYAFVTVLASFLVGIALGSFVARGLAGRIVRPRIWFGWAQVGIAASSLATLPILGSGTVQGWLTGHGADWILLIVLRFGVSFAVMLVPATLIGMTFPLAGRIWTREIGRLGREVGQVYGANTLGNVVGAVASGFALLPLLGLQRSIVALAALNLVNAGWGLAPGRERRTMVRSVPIAAGIAACVLLATLWRPAPFAAWDERPGDETLYYEEGVVATVKVVASAGDRRWMAVDGITIGQSSGGVDAKQQALAHLPFLLMPEAPPRSLLSIGLGTGVLIGEVVRHPAVDRVWCLEISPAVVRGAKLFGESNGGVLDSPKASVITDDGVIFLRRSSDRYDAIVSDAKSRRAHAGNSLFFSEDYYRLCREHLDTAGLMVQWVPLDMPHSEMRVILRTFSGIFPHVYVWVAPTSSAFLVGTNEPLTVDLDHVGRMLADPVTAHLARYGWSDAAGFAALLTVDRDDLLDRIGERGPVNTLERPILEFYSPRAYAIPPSTHRADNLELLMPSGVAMPEDVRLRGETTPLRAAREGTLLFLRASSMLERREPELAERAIPLLVEALDVAPDHGVLRHAALGALDAACRLAPASAVAQRTFGALLRSQGRVAEAEPRLRRAVELDPADARAQRELGVAVASRGDLSSAERYLRRAAVLAPDDAPVLADLARVVLQQGRHHEALELFEKADRLRPDTPEILEGMARAVMPDDPARAVRLAERAAELTGYRRAYVIATLSDALAAAGEGERADRLVPEAGKPLD